MSELESHKFDRKKYKFNKCFSKNSEFEKLKFAGKINRSFFRLIQKFSRKKTLKCSTFENSEFLKLEIFQKKLKF